jgi:hypothetical protein
MQQRAASTSSSGRLLKGSNLARAPQMQPIMQAGHLIVACQRVGLLLPLSLGTDILEPCNRSDALGAISSDSEQDEYEVGLHHLEYTDNCIQQYFDHTHPDGADELFLSSDVLSPSFKADHEAQSCKAACKVRAIAASSDLRELTPSSSLPTRTTRMHVGL